MRASTGKATGVPPATGPPAAAVHIGRSDVRTEHRVEQLVHAFTGFAISMQACSPEHARNKQFYAVRLGAGQVGLVLDEGIWKHQETAYASHNSESHSLEPRIPVSDEHAHVDIETNGVLLERSVVVSELRSDPRTGQPLLALASGQVSIGDRLIAVNGHLLLGEGDRALEAVAIAFQGPRPLTLLFERKLTQT